MPQYIFPSIAGTLTFAERFLIAWSIKMLVPIVGIAIGALFIRKKINAVKTGEWREELSNGFPSALKILFTINWDETFEEISLGKISYALYSALKIIAYIVITAFGVGFFWNLGTYLILDQVGLLGGASIWLAPFIVYVLVRKDLSKRYNQIRALDKLLLELRGLKAELESKQF
jgi:hypothetical protein